jgi:transcriptional regulator NrdR family protein
MKCQKCGNEKLKVERTDKFDTVNRRVLRCVKCGWAAGTEETIIETDPKGSKKGDIGMPSAV